MKVTWSIYDRPYDLNSRKRSRELFAFYNKLEYEEIQTRLGHYKILPRKRYNNRKKVDRINECLPKPVDARSTWGNVDIIKEWLPQPANAPLN